MKRRIILELEVPDDQRQRILMISLELCDWIEKYKDADLIQNYGLAFEIPQYDLVNLPTDKKTVKDIGHGAAEEVYGSTD